MSGIEPQHRYWSTEEQRWVYPGEVELPEPYTTLLPNDIRKEACDVYTAEQVRAAILAERGRCAALCDDQREVYAAKMEQALSVGMIDRWERFNSYAEAVDHIADAIRRSPHG